MSIDWTKPIELMDGTPVRLATGDDVPCASNPDPDGDFWIRKADGTLLCVDRCGRQHGSRSGQQYVRNRPEPTTLADWAKNRAVDLTARESKKWTVSVDDVLDAFARYIEAHEQPPVDPVVMKAREMLAEESPAILREGIMAGKWDTGGHMAKCIRILRAGMELAR